MVWASGAQYQGEWKHNQMHGKGKLVHANHEIYEGDFVGDKANGYGKYLND